MCESLFSKFESNRLKTMFFESNRILKISFESNRILRLSDSNRIKRKFISPKFVSQVIRQPLTRGHCQLLQTERLLCKLTQVYRRRALPLSLTRSYHTTQFLRGIPTNDVKWSGAEHSVKELMIRGTAPCGSHTWPASGLPRAGLAGWRYCSCARTAHICSIHSAYGVNKKEAHNVRVLAYCRSLVTLVS